MIARTTDKSGRKTLKPESGTVRIGISGWTYKPWRGVFFPKGLAQKRELAYAADCFRSIEVNGTFYGTQRAASFERWREATPEDFVFSVKAPRFITHVRRLRDIEVPIANFFASGVLRLGRKLGPILWQFPPSFAYEPALWDSFLALIPHDLATAQALARKHDAHVPEDDALAAELPSRIRHAVEIRHDSYVVPEFISQLRSHHVALVCADTVEWPRLMDLTTDFAYCRLHGSEKLYASGYDSSALDDWSRRVVAWARGEEPEIEKTVGAQEAPTPRDVYVYFDNDVKVRAPFDALALSERVAKVLA